jgi:tetratricopeptide (TPR) repeat protein
MAHRAMARLLSAILVASVLLVAAPALADKDADKRAAADPRSDTKARLAACSRLLAAEDLTKTERTWAFLQRAKLYRYTDENAKALADYTKAEELDPGNPDIYQGRARLYFNTDKYPQADEQLSKALKLDPRDAWSWYARGRARVNLKKYDDALKDYDKALALDPRHFSSYSGRARLHIRRKNYDKSIKDCNGALALNPYYAGAYAVRGSAHGLTDKDTEAMHDHAVAFSLDPNLIGPDRDLKRLADAAKASGDTTGPVAYQPPKKGLSISYLQTLRPEQAKKSDMEESILALAGWFKQKRVPVPSHRVFLVREVTANKEGLATIKPRHKYPKFNRGKLPVEKIDYYRSLWPTVFPMGGTGEVLAIELDRAPLDALWPLKVGNKSAGVSKLVYVGPDPLTPPAQFFGCKKPGDRIPFGQIKWTGGVVGKEKVVVPAGVFNAIVIRFEEEMEIRMAGRSKKHPSVVTWWYAPSVRWWVKRARQAGPDLVVDEAETIK